MIFFNRLFNRKDEPMTDYFTATAPETAMSQPPLAPLTEEELAVLAAKPEDKMFVTTDEQEPTEAEKLPM